MLDLNYHDEQDVNGENLGEYSLHESADYSRPRLRSSMGSVVMQDVPDTAMRFDVPVFSRADENNPNERNGASLNREPIGRSSGGIAGLLYLLIALTIFSCQSSVFVYLNGLNPEVYTACNILCSSSIFGVFFMAIYLFLYKRSVSWADVKKMSYVDLMALFVGSTLYSVVGPYLFYVGLLTIEVPMASIVQRLESINFLILSYFALNTVISRFTLISAILTLMGITIAVLFNALFTGDRLEFPIGYLYILLSGYATSSSLLLAKKYLAKCNTGVIALSRTMLGAIMFYALSHILNASSKEFASMELWKYAMPYGFIYIFVGQVAWVTALAINPPVVLSVGINILFCLNLAWSALLLNVYPTKESWVGAGFIFASIIVAIYESYRVHTRNGRDISSLLKKEVSSSIDTDHRSLFGDFFNYIVAGMGNKGTSVEKDTTYHKIDASESDEIKRKDADADGNLTDGNDNDVDLRTKLI